MGILFDGVDQYAQSTATYGGVNDYCLGFWFNFPVGHSDGNFDRALSQGATDTDDGGISFELNGNPNDLAYRIFYETGSGSQAIGSAFTFTPGVWHHAGATFNTTSGDHEYYIDGQSQGTGTRNVTGNNASELTPAARSGGTQSGNVAIAEIGIWHNRILTAGEWGALGAGAIPPMVAPEDLVGYYRLIRTPLNNRIASDTLTELNAPVATNHPPVFGPSAQILQFPPVAVASTRRVFVVG